MTDSPLRPLTKLPLPILPPVPPKKGSIQFHMNTPSSTTRNVTVIDLEDDEFPEKVVSLPAANFPNTTTPKSASKNKHKSSRVAGADGHAVTPQKNSLHNYFQAQSSSKKTKPEFESAIVQPLTIPTMTSQPIQIIDSSEDETISLVSTDSVKSSPVPERPIASASSTRSSPGPLSKTPFGKKTDLRDYLQPGIPKLPPISDDLDPILLPFSAPLPKFKEFSVPDNDPRLTMNEWAQLMVVHDFFYKFSSDVLNMKSEDYTYEILEDLICNTTTINRDGIQFICNLIEFIESEEHNQDSPQLPPVNPVNFQWYIGEILPDKTNIFATTEFPAIPPRDRLKALNYLIDLAMDTDQFSQYLHTGVDERISQLKKEKRERTDTRRQLESQISDLTRSILAAEKGVVDAEEEMKRLARLHTSDEDSGEDSEEEDSEAGGEVQSISHHEESSEVQEKQIPRDERTSRQKMLAEEKSRKKLVATLKGKCTKLTKDIEKMVRQRESKRKSITDINTNDLTHQSQVEFVASKYRGGIIPSRNVVPTSQEILLIGYDRYARAYWHWKPIGGIIIEEHQYSEKSEKPDLSIVANNEESTAKDEQSTNASNNEVISKTGCNVNDDYRKPQTKWYYMDDSRQLLLLIRPLNNRGIREKSLRSMLTSIRPLFINSLGKFRSWLKREIGETYDQTEITATDNTPNTLEAHQPTGSIELPLEDASLTDEKTEPQTENQIDDIKDDSLDQAPVESFERRNNSVESTIYIQEIKNTIQKQVDQLSSILFMTMKNTKLPEIDVNSSVEEYLSYIRSLFARVNDIKNNHLSKLPAEAEKRIRWLRTTSFQEDFDENIRTFSSLNVNLEMCIKDIENFELSVEEPEEENNDAISTKQDRQVNLRDRKSRNRTTTKEINNSESENESSTQKKPTRRSHRIIEDDLKSNDEDTSNIPSTTEHSASPNKKRKLRTRKATQRQSSDLEEHELPAKRDSLPARQTRNSASKRSRDEEVDDTNTGPRRKLRPRRDVTYTNSVDLQES
ncbi:hypothetical protein K7432_005039 [Basidiobolus ranarum]|uniref:WHIM2 domain-containing protein n=1 Tax=Basidiobolus ranarum TaxID=34480 RepID=A0ABR2W3P2_9FUNG